MVKISGKKWCQKVDKCKDKLKEKHGKYAKRAEDHYYNNVSKGGQRLRIEVPLLWSNTQVLRSSIFSANPIPEIRRRNDSEDPTTKQLAEMLEKAISYQIDQSDFHSDVKRSILDYLLTDKGVLRTRYEAKTGIAKDETGMPIFDDEGNALEDIVNQTVIVDHVPWNRFYYDVGKDWAECDWICYVHYMSIKEIKSQFGVVIEKSNIETSQDDKDKANKIEVYEIWDKKTRTIIEVATCRDKPLRVTKDPLNLEGFYTCTKPMISNMRTDKYIGYPDFMMIEQQLNTVNMLATRIKKLTRTIKDVGFHESSFEELAELPNADDGELVAVTDLLKKMDGRTDFSSIVVKMPIEQQAMVVQLLEQQKQQAKEEIYEITGLSDIIRGSTKASETATAQTIKAQYANVRLQDKISTVNSMLREVMRMFSEIISEHFDPMILQTMTGVEVTPEMVQIMKNDLSRSFSIDVETDSTIAVDEQADKQTRNEMLQSVTAYLQTVKPLQQQGLITADIASELLLVNVRGYKHAKNLEDMILAQGGSEEQLQQLQQQLQQQGQQAQQTQQQMGQQIQALQGQLQQAQGQIQQFNQQEEQRKNIETQGEAKKDDAHANKLNAEAQKIAVETQTIGYPQAPVYL